MQAFMFLTSSLRNHDTRVVFSAAFTSIVVSWMRIVVVGFAFLGAPVGASPSLETFVLTAGGRTSGTLNPPCTTLTPPLPVLNFFGVWGPAIPTAGLDSCGIAGGFDDLFSPTGPLTEDRSLVSSWPNGNSFSGFAEATSGFGILSARAHAQFSGFISSSNVIGSDAFGIAEDGFAITSPSFASGQSGSVIFHVTVTGALSTNNPSRFGVQLGNRVNNQTYLLFACYGDAANSLPTLYSHNGAGLAGFVRSPGAMSGSDVISSAQIPFVFGTSFEYKLGLLTNAVPALSSIVDSDFDARITSIEVKGPGGQTVTEFVITSASGTQYGSTGVSGVAEVGVDNSPRLVAFPNPAGARVQLHFNRPITVGAIVEIFDLVGRRVWQPEDGVAPGSQSVSWDGRTNEGVLLPSGLYFARLSSPEGRASARVMLVR